MKTFFFNLFERMYKCAMYNLGLNPKVTFDITFEWSVSVLFSFSVGYCHANFIQPLMETAWLTNIDRNYSITSADN